MEKNMMNKVDKICICIVIGLSAFGVLGSSIFFFVDIPKSVIDIISSWIGIVGTIASVILSIMAMIYSNKSSKDAETSLKDITAQYKALCDELTVQSIKNNLGKSGIENIINKC